MVFNLKIRLRSHSRVQTDNRLSNHNAGPVLTPRGVTPSRTKRWREKLRLEPDAFANFLSRDALRKRHYRASLSKENRLHQNEITKQRMKKYRKRLREKNKPSQKNDQPKCTTRADKEKKARQREKWRVNKQKQRQKMTSQKRRRINEKRREEYCQKKTVGADASPRHSSAKRVSMHRVRKSLPKNPEEYASTVKSLLENPSPRKQVALKKIGINSSRTKLNEKITGAVKTLFCTLKCKSGRRSKAMETITAAMSVLKKYRMRNSASRVLNVPMRSLTSRKNMTTRQDALAAETRNAVVSFLKDEANPIPCKRSVSKKTHEGKSVLDRSMKVLHKEFLNANPDKKISLAKFCQLRPRSILLASKNKLRQCLCEYCTNINLILKVLNKLASSERRPQDQICDVYRLSSLTLCERLNGELRHKNVCIKRQCDSCSVRNIKKKFEELIDRVGDREITWYQYESEKISNVTKSGESVTRKCLVKKNGSIINLIDSLIVQAIPVSLHLHRASWQNAIFQGLRKDVPKKWVVMVLDFAENYTCNLQDEVQACHWYHEQATVHPIVAYYPCPKCASATTTESIVFITDEKKHDHHAVRCFLDITNQHLQSTRNLDIVYQVQFTDGCSSQYKSKGPFYDISMAKQNYDFHVERAFFGSRHGKGPSDGESAVVKSRASAAVTAGKAVITTAFEMFQFCVENLTIGLPTTADQCNHFLRQFFWVSSEEIKTDLDQHVVKTIQGTRQIHSVRCVEPGVVAIRNLSCFCSNCRAGVNPCENQQYVEPWRTVTIHTGPSMVSQPDASTEKTCPDILRIAADDQLPAEQEHQNPGHEHDFHDVEMDGRHKLDTLPCNGEVVKMEVGKYYAVYFSRQYYLGRVLTADRSGSFEFTFLHKSGAALFDWPKRKDKDIISSERVFCGPITLIGHGPFQIEEQMFHSIERKYNQLRKVLH